MDWGVKLSIPNRVEVKNEWSFTHLPPYAVCAISDTHNLALLPVFYCTGTFIFNSFKISTQCSTVLITWEVLWDLYWWNMLHTGRYTNTAEFQLRAIKFSQ